MGSLAYNSPFEIKNSTVENLRPLKVRVIGAGFSGILAAIRIPEKLRNLDFAVYEKSDGIGGVWQCNKYPGVACDIPSHSYQYSFAPNPRWSSLYAPGAEIQQYLQDTAEKYGATRYIKTSHKLEKAIWDESKRLWHITVHNLKTGVKFDEEINVLIAAKGQLNEISWPDIEGLDSFEGKIMHSADWDTSYDFSNKKIAMIGNGSSSIQILPHLQKAAGTSVKTFMRSPTWITSSFGDPAMQSLGLDPANPKFPPAKLDEICADSEAYIKVRKVFEDSGSSIHDCTILGTGMQQGFQAYFTQGMKERLAKKPELFDFLLPKFAPGCRRMTPGIGYLEALCEDNVEVITTGITRVTPTGIQTADGVHHDIDMLICATGFRVAEAPAFEVVGRGGLTLSRRWAALPESYLSVAVDGFPNYLMMFGPNSAIGFGSLTMILEGECDYIVKCVRKLQKEDYDAMEPKPERVADFTSYVGAYFKNTVYMDDCKSWYKLRGRGNWVSGLWPGSTLHALEALRSPRWEDFNFERAGAAQGNALRWLGNGWSTTQTEGDPSWYLNADEVSWPLEGKPEEGGRYTVRPWSH